MREKVIIRFIENSNINLRYAFDKWRNHNQVLAMQASFESDKKKMIISILEKFLKCNRSSLIRMILKKFANNSGIKRV